MYDNVLVEYWLVYDRHLPDTSIVSPKNNKCLCNCGNQTWLIGQFVYVEGISFDDLTQLNYHTGTSTYANGISLSVDLSCNQAGYMCKEYDKKNAIALTLAYTVLYKAAELTIEKILNSPEVNRYTLMNREYLWGKRNHFRKEYQDRVLYITKTADIKSTDCFICKAKSNDLQITGIML
jgi:hypothetical protein